MVGWDTLKASGTRLASAGHASIDERGSTCCYAKQDMFWVADSPDRERWETYTVLADSPTFRGPATEEAVCCGAPISDKLTA